MGELTIQVASDLHLEAHARRGRRPCAPLPPPDAFQPLIGRDLLVLAGDIGIEHQAIEFIDRELRVSPVVYVPGNHEYYSRQMRQEIDADWKAMADARPGLFFLLGEAAVIDGVRFWGGPWYSDLWGASPRTVEGRRLHEMVGGAITDFHPGFSWGAPWTVDRHVSAHREQTERLRAAAGEVDVVVTHWPPTKEAIHPRFYGDLLNPYFIKRPPRPGARGGRPAVGVRAHARALRLPRGGHPLHRQPLRLPRRAAHGRRGLQSPAERYNRGAAQPTGRCDESEEGAPCP